MRLWTRNGHDWSDRFPLIVEAALRNRNSLFVLDGEAVLLGVDGRSDLKGLHSRKHDAEVEFYAFDILIRANIGLSAKWRSRRDILLIGADGVPELHRQHKNSGKAKANN